MKTRKTEVVFVSGFYPHDEIPEELCHEKIVFRFAVNFESGEIHPAAYAEMRRKVAEKLEAEEQDAPNVVRFFRDDKMVCVATTEEQCTVAFYTTRAMYKSFEEICEAVCAQFGITIRDKKEAPQLSYIKSDKPVKTYPRVQWFFPIASLLAMPIHMHVPCEVSGQVAGFGAIMLCCSGILVLFGRASLKSVLASFGAFLLHGLLIH